MEQKKRKKKKKPPIFYFLFFNGYDANSVLRHILVKLLSGQSVLLSLCSYLSEFGVASLAVI